MQSIAAAPLRRLYSDENYIKAPPLDPVGDGLQHPTFEARKALIRLAKSKIWSLIEKVGKSLPHPA